ncbi:MAG: hypothetical protein ACTSQY_07725 [Candidatus Odinarchaeia archaeon]
MRNQSTIKKNILPVKIELLNTVITDARKINPRLTAIKKFLIILIL